MNWIIIAMFPPLLWGISNFIDKYLLTKYFKEGGVGTFLIFTSLVGTLLMPIMYLFNPSVVYIDIKDAVLMTFAGILFVFAYFPYMKALSNEEASSVGSLFQLIPVFAYILAYFILGEQLNSKQLYASILIILGGFVIMLDINDGFPKLKMNTFFLMVTSSIIFAAQSVIFKFVAIEENIWTTTFWQYAGFTISAIMLLSVSKYREEFKFAIKRNKASFIGVNIGNELINLSGEIFLTIAMLAAPIALVWVINSFMPVFLFIIGIIVTIFFPNFGAESLRKRHLAQKFVSIAIMILGAYLLNK